MTPVTAVPGWYAAFAAVRGAALLVGVPLALVGVVLTVVLDVVGGPEIVGVGAIATGILVAVAGALLSMIPGSPRLPSAEIGPPVQGRWQCLNSPTDKVPSHGTHGFGQTYAVDMLLDPADGSRPRFGEGAAFAPPTDYPAFGAPVVSPVDGVVVRAHDRQRDHRARSGWLAFVYVIGESLVRETFGLNRMLGNHVVLRADDGCFVALAHLRRGSVAVAGGDRVARAAPLGECGNSGNSTEPHVHLQVCASPRLRFAVGLPFTMTGTTDDDGLALDALPANGQVFVAPTD